MSKLNVPHNGQNVNRGGAPIIAGPRLVTEDDYLDFATVDKNITNGIAHLNTKHAFVMLGGQARVAMEEKGDCTFVRTEDFLKYYGNKKVATGTKKAGPNMGEDFLVSWGAVWLESPDRREYARVEFRPELDREDSEKTGIYNLFQGFAYESSKRGSCQLFLDHWLDNICAGNLKHFMYQFAWFARIFQKPAAKDRPGVSLAFRSRAKGNGKSLIVDSIGKLLGPKHYTVARDAETITGQFNAHLERCLLLHAEEALWAGNRSDQGILNSLITNENLNVQRKNVDRYNAKNHINICVTSNEDWIVPASTDERRWAVFEVPMHKYTQNDDYFGAIVRDLENGGYEALLQRLFNFDLSQVNLRKVPQTAALTEQKLHSLQPVDAWLLDAARNDRILDAEGKIIPFGTVGIYRDAVTASIAAFCKRTRKHAPIDSVIGRQLTATLHSDLGKQRGLYNLPVASVIMDRLAAKLKITRKELDALLADDEPESLPADRVDVMPTSTPVSTLAPPPDPEPYHEPEQEESSPGGAPIFSRRAAAVVVSPVSNT